MNIGKSTKLLLPLFLVAIMVMSPVASAASAGMGGMASSQQNASLQSTDPGETVQVTDEVAVWDRSMLPLRADTDEADTVIDNHRFFINDPDGAERDANRGDIGVFAAGEDVPITLSSDVDGANTEQFAGEDVQIVIAESDGNPMGAIQDPMNFALSDRVDSLNDLVQLQSDLEDARDTLEEAEEARDTLEAWDDGDEDVDEDDAREAAEFLFTNPDEVIDEEDTEVGDLREEIEEAQELVEDFQEIQDEINENIEFSVETAEIDEDGELEFELDQPEAGQYGVMVSTGDIFSESDGDLSLSGSGTVIGMEAVAVHEQPSEVSAPDSIEPGENVTFDIETDLDAGDDDVSHAVALYNEDAFTGTGTTLNVQDDISQDLEAEDLLIEHDITVINGVADLSATDPDRLEEFDTLNLLDDMDAERTEGPFVLADVIENRTEGTLLEGVRTEATDDVTLDASMTAASDVGPDGELTVETFEDWEEGEYQFVHVAVDQEDPRSFETAEGTVEVAEDDVAPPPAPPAPPDPDPPEDKLQLNTEIIDDNTQQVSELGISPGTSVTIQLQRDIQNPDYVFTEVGLNTKDTTVTDLDVTFRHTDDRPGAMDQVPTEAGGLTFMELEYADEVGESVEDVTLTTEVSQARLADDDRKPEEVTFYRHDGGDWEELDSEIMESDDETVTYLVDSPGLSVYAPTYEDVDVDEPGEVNVIDAELSEDEIEVGESVDVTATIENPGDEAATDTVELLVDGETVDTTEVTLDAGETNTIEFTEEFDEAGEYEIDVNDVNAGTLTVVEEDVEEPIDDEFSFLWYVFVALMLIMLIAVTAVMYAYSQGELDDPLQ